MATTFRGVSIATDWNAAFRLPTGGSSRLVTSYTMMWSSPRRSKPRPLLVSSTTNKRSLTEAIRVRGVHVIVCMTEHAARSCLNRSVGSETKVDTTIMPIWTDIKRYAFHTTNKINIDLSDKMALKPTTGCYWQTSTSYSSQRLDESIGGA